MEKIRLYELRPLKIDNFQYWRGTKETFGVVSALCTISPLFNFIKNFKYRGMKLDINLQHLIKLKTKDGKNIE